jgi:hypothetical protein
MTPACAACAKPSVHNAAITRNFKLVISDSSLGVFARKSENPTQWEISRQVFPGDPSKIAAG